MKTTKAVREILNVNSRTASRLIRQAWEDTYHEMDRWWSSFSERLGNWADHNKIELPDGYLPEGGVNPEWSKLTDQFIEEEGDFSKEEEAYVLGFWSREVGLEPKWEGDETSMIRWMLRI